MEWVDLNLPSGTLWGKYNLGDSSIKDSGLYFAWGETCGYTKTQAENDRDFSYNDYKFAAENDCGGYSKYNTCDELTLLEDRDNAAKLLLGNDVDIPDMQYLGELLNNTYYNGWYDESANRTIGVRFTSKDDANNVLYIPFTGTKFNGNSYLSESGVSFYCKNLGFYYSFFYDGEGGVSPNVNEDSGMRISCLPLRPILPGPGIPIIDNDDEQW